MTTLKIKYTFSEALKRELFVNRADRSTDVTVEVSDARLSPVAREAMLRARRSRPGWGFTPRLLLELAAEDSDDAFSAAVLAVDWPEPLDDAVREPGVDRAVEDIETLLVRAAQAAPAILEAEEARRVAATAQAEAARHAALEELLGRGADSLVRARDGRLYLTDSVYHATLGHWTLDHFAKSDPRAAEFIARAERLVAERNEAADARDAARAEALRNWALANLSEDDRKRFEAGFLAEEELLGLLRDEVFGPLSEFARYRKLTEADIEHGEGCYRPDARFSVETVEGLSREQYAALERLQAAAPAGATFQARKHDAWCARDTDECDGGIVSRYSVLVTVTWEGTPGVQVFSREYALP